MNARETKLLALSVVGAAVTVGLISFLPESVAWYPYAFVDILTGLLLFIIVLRWRAADSAIVDNTKMTAESLREIKKLVEKFVDND